MDLVKLNDETFVRPAEVVSVEREVVNSYQSLTPSDGYYVKTFDGTRLTLGNGRKVYIDGMMPADVIAKLEGAKNERV